MFKAPAAVSPSSAQAAPSAEPWNVLIVDDEPMMHTLMRLALRDLVFEGRPVAFHSATSDQQARRLLATLSDVAVAFIDVVMESDHAGFDLVTHIRDERRDSLMRIVLRTGQPGLAAERVALHDHDINAYLNKADSDVSHLYSALVTSLRAYRQMAQMQEDIRRLEALATLDGLTGLGCQRQLREALWRSISNARRRCEPLSLVFLDIDDFKRINDNRGHLAGDEILRSVARAIVQHSRAEDCCFRYGGDEFVVILTACTVETAREHYCERLCRELDRLGISASLGVAQTGPLQFDDVDVLLQRADADMYSAKRDRKRGRAEPVSRVGD